MTELKDPLVVTHGTYIDAWKIIKWNGLNKMSRNHIHFSSYINNKQLRKDRNVFIFIDTALAMKDNIVFLRSKNNVILTTGINGRLDPKYFTKVIDISNNTILFENNFENNLKNTK